MTFERAVVSSSPVERHLLSRSAPTRRSRPRVARQAQRLLCATTLLLLLSGCALTRGTQQCNLGLGTVDTAEQAISTLWGLHPPEGAASVIPIARQVLGIWPTGGTFPFTYHNNSTIVGGITQGSYGAVGFAFDLEATPLASDPIWPLTEIPATRDTLWGVVYVLEYTFPAPNCNSTMEWNATLSLEFPRGMRFDSNHPEPFVGSFVGFDWVVLEDPAGIFTVTDFYNFLVLNSPSAAHIDSAFRVPARDAGGRTSWSYFEDTDLQPIYRSELIRDEYPVLPGVESHLYLGVNFLFWLQFNDLVADEYACLGDCSWEFTSPWSPDGFFRVPQGVGFVSTPR